MQHISELLAPYKTMTLQLLDYVPYEGELWRITEFDNSDTGKNVKLMKNNGAFVWVSKEEIQKHDAEMVKWATNGTTNAI